MQVVPIPTSRPTPAPLRSGDHVQVWNRFLDTWAGDFEIVESRPREVWVRHPHEATALPRALDPEHVRVAEPPHDA